MVNAKTKGERIAVSMRVFDGAGAPLKDALVEIWQADAAGLYNSPAETRGTADPNFAGWGRKATDMETGECVFETIKPGRVPFPDGRLMAPHITVWIVARGINIGLHTRMYFGDEEKANAEDPVLARIEHRVRVPTLIAPHAAATATLSTSISRGRRKRSSSIAEACHDRFALRSSAAVGAPRRRGDGAPVFGSNAEIAAMVAFERALAEAEAAEGIIEQAAARSDRSCAGIVLARHGQGCGPAWRATASSCPNWCGRCAQAVGEPHGAQVHFGATSQDVIDTALVLRLKPIVERFDRQLAELIGRFAAHRTPASAPTALTGMHAHAAGDPDPRLATASQRGGSRCERHRERLAEQSPTAAGRAVRRRGGHAGKVRRQGPARAQRRWPRGLALPTRRNGTASATASPISPAGCRWSPAASASSARTSR